MICSRLWRWNISRGIWLRRVWGVHSFATASTGISRRKRIPSQISPPTSSISTGLVSVNIPTITQSHGHAVRVVASVECAREVAGILCGLPPNTVVSWHIETSDIDCKRFHTAGTGARILCVSFAAKGVDFGGGAESVFVDVLPLDGEEIVASEETDHDVTSERESLILLQFKPYFENANCLKTLHSFVDGFHGLAAEGIHLQGLESDTKYLCRLANTALGSWEGKANQDVDPYESGVDTLDIAAEKGYDLRSCAVNFLESNSVGPTELKKEKFLKKLNGTKIAHYSSTMREYWVGRCAESARLVGELRSVLKSKLESTDWTSEVSAGRIVQSTQWDLACIILRPLVALLSEVEERGVKIDFDFLTATRARIETLLDQHRHMFMQSASSMRDPVSGNLLNPDAVLINPHSGAQVRQLLFGCPSEKSSELFQYGKKSENKRIPRCLEFTGQAGGPVTVCGIGLRPLQSKMKKKRLADFSAKGLPSVNHKLLVEYGGRDPLGGSLGRAADSDQLGRFNDPSYTRLGCEMLFHLAKVNRLQYVVGSFVDPLMEKVTSDGRIHPSLSLDTSTGRLVCRKPNLHNPPNASDQVGGVRAAFVAAEGNVLLVADYSQLELRILAHVTNCQSMIKSLNAGGDYHSWTAYEMFDEVRQAVRNRRCRIVEEAVDESDTSSIGAPLPPTIKQLFPLHRAKAKAINFSIAYGKCARSIAEDLNLELAEAEDLLKQWYASKPEVAVWKSQVVFDARVTKKVKSILGRSRDIPHINKPAWKGRSERAAVNHCIQGSAADIAICAMIRVGESPELKNLGFHLLMQIHDEFILEGPKMHAPAAQKILSDLMRNPFADLNPDYKFKVELEVDAGIGPNWRDAKP